MQEGRVTNGSLKIATLISIFLMFGNGCSDKDDATNDSTKDTPSFVIDTLPATQTSPIEDQTKLGRPAGFLLLVSSLSLPYKSAELVTLMVVDQNNQWINTDRKIVVNLKSSGPNLQILSEPERLPIESLSIAIGTPTGMIALKSDSLESSTLHVTSDAPVFSASVTFGSSLSRPTRITNNASISSANVCSPISFVLTDSNGRTAFFSTTDQTVLKATTAGCSLYTDATCSSQTSTVVVPADANDIHNLYVLSATGSAFIDFVNSDFSGRASCGSIE